MDNQSLQPRYLTQLRKSGVFTEGDLLELEDHFFTIYEAELDNGIPTHLALQRAEQALGKREEVIAAFAQKRKWAWAKDLGSFFVFGLVVNLLGLYFSVTSVIYLLTFLAHFTNLEDLASVTIPIVTSGYLLFITLGVWLFLKNQTIWQEKLPPLLANIKWKKMALPFLLSLAIGIGFRFAVDIIPHGKAHIWRMNAFETSYTLWAYYYSIIMIALALFFGWRAYRSHRTKEKPKMRWSLRLFLFFIAGYSGPFIILLMHLITRIEFIDVATMRYWVRIVDLIYSVSLVSIILLFPIAYRHTWQRKQYLA